MTSTPAMVLEMPRPCPARESLSGRCWTLPVRRRSAPFPFHSSSVSARAQDVAGQAHHAVGVHFPPGQAKPVATGGRGEERDASTQEHGDHPEFDLINLANFEKATEQLSPAKEPDVPPGRRRRQGEAGRDLLRDTLTDAVQAGELPPGTAVTTLARMVDTTVSGSLLTWPTYREGTAQAWVLRDLELVLRKPDHR